MIEVCPVADLPDGEAVRVEGPPGEDAIAVFNVGGEFFALDDTCSHQDASLADGFVEDDCTVECPLHASCFDLRTGEVSGPPAKVGVRTHAITIHDGIIFVLPRPAAVPGVSA